MPPKFFEWTFTFLDLVKLTGMSNNAIHQDVSRGNLNPGDLESLFVWLSRTAKPALKRKMLRHALYEDTNLPQMRYRKKKEKKNGDGGGDEQG